MELSACCLSLKTSKTDRKELTIIMCMWMSNIMRSFSHSVLPLHHSKRLVGSMDGWMHRPPLAGNMKRMHVCTTAERLWFDIAMQMHAPSVAPSDKLPSHKSLPASLLTAWCVLLQQISCREYVSSRRFYACLVSCNGD